MAIKKTVFLCFFITFLLLIANISFAIDKKNSKKLGEELYDAVLFQDLVKMNQLIEKGADVNYIQMGRPLLGWAAQNGNLEVIKALIKAKVDVNKGDQGGVGHTPLMRAIETQHVTIVQALLDAKANPNAQTPDGETCLNMAVESRKPEIVRAIVKAGADVSYVDKNGDSPALTAAQDGMSESLEIIKILGEAKANMNASNAAYTPLIYAVQQGNKELVSALIAAGANPNAKTKDGNTPVHTALDNKEILETLLQAKADPDIEDSSGEAPIFNAIRYNNTEAVKVLLSAKADITKKSPYGTSPLELAKQNYQEDIIALLTPKTETDNNQALYNAPGKISGSKCTIVDAAKKQMEIHGLLQKQVDAGKFSTDIFRTFGEDTKDYGDLLTSDPGKACDLLENLRIKYGV